MTPETNAELFKSVAYIKQETDKRINKLFTQKVNEASQIDAEYRKLLEKMQTLIMRGGKRIRPFLAVVGYRMTGGTDIKACLDTIVSLELLHNFLLIHDDVMDNDSRRYGGYNINGYYERLFTKRADKNLAKQLGNAMAILAGDINHSLVFECVNNAPLNDEIRQSLINYLVTITFNVAGGQQLDVLGAVKNTWSVRHLERVYIYKTALYSITYPLQFGMLVGSDKSKVSLAEEYGKHVGIAFQLHDDLLGLFGTERQIGKPVGSDLEEGKKTLVFAFAKQLASAKEWKVLESFMYKPNISYADMQMVRAILSDCGARSKAIVAAQQHVDTAIKIIARSKLEPELKTLLEDFATFCVTRKK